MKSGRPSDDDAESSDLTAQSNSPRQTKPTRVFSIARSPLHAERHVRGVLAARPERGGIVVSSWPDPAGQLHVVSETSFIMSNTPSLSSDLAGARFLPPQVSPAPSSTSTSSSSSIASASCQRRTPADGGGGGGGGGGRPHPPPSLSGSSSPAAVPRSAPSGDAMDDSATPVTRFKSERSLASAA